jgi:hypothetical protein
MERKQGAKAKKVRDAALDLGLTFSWVDDDAADPSWVQPGSGVNEVLGCVVKDRHGDVLASLWGITDPDNAYCREVEADLAAEALAEIRSSALAAL